MADWLRDYLDRLVPPLLAADGPFSSCRSGRKFSAHHHDQEPLPVEPAPASAGKAARPLAALGGPFRGLPASASLAASRRVTLRWGDGRTAAWSATSLPATRGAAPGPRAHWGPGLLADRVDELRWRSRSSTRTGRLSTGKAMSSCYGEAPRVAVGVYDHSLTDPDLPRGYRVLLRTVQPAEESPLTAREMAILGLVARGGTAEAIARQLGSSPRTVHKHLEHAYRKLGVTDRATAVRVAIELGLLTRGSHSNIRLWLGRELVLEQRARSCFVVAGVNSRALPSTGSALISGLAS